MGFVSILDKKIQPYKDFSQPEFMVDLNLDQVVNQIQMAWPEEVDKFYYYLPKDKEVSDYRRAIYADIKKEGVFEALNCFMERMRERNHAEENCHAVFYPLQKHVWFVLEVALYCDACTGLNEALQGFEFASEGMQEFRKELSAYVSSEAYVKMQDAAREMRDEITNFHITLIYENDRIVVTEARQTGTYENFLHQAFGESSDRIKSPFMKIMNLTNLEQEIVEIFRKKHGKFVANAKKFYDVYEEYDKDWIFRFADEVPFYLSYHRFRDVMISLGYTFTAPTVDESMDMKASGLYDLALALVNSRQGKEVVSNGLEYYDGERFFVLTGPNQGGKTTFARSLGQLVYFTKLGLDVPADVANVHHFTRILTHFSVEESVETGRGKLKEELVRLKPMMEEQSDGAFVIINELFTTAANYDACLMGKKVLAHFIGEGCRGIYVTHLKELTEGMEGIVSLRAMLDDKRIQSFRIMRKEADDSACAQNQVNKYRLTYEQLKERLSR